MTKVFSPAFAVVDPNQPVSDSKSYGGLFICNWTLHLREKKSGTPDALFSRILSQPLTSCKKS
jgi:hypothetical protein